MIGWVALNFFYFFFYEALCVYMSWQSWAKRPELCPYICISLPNFYMCVSLHCIVCVYAWPVCVLTIGKGLNGLWKKYVSGGDSRCSVSSIQCVWLCVCLYWFSLSSLQHCARLESRAFASDTPNHLSSNRAKHSTHTVDFQFTLPRLHTTRHVSHIQ